MSQNFNYREISIGKFKPSKKPTIPITLTNNGQQVKIVAMVDSGADILIIPKGVAEILNLNSDKVDKEQVLGLGGFVESTHAKVGLIVDYNHEKISLLVEALVVPTNDFQPLIGRKGFFDRFEVTINEREKWVKIKDLGKF